MIELSDLGKYHEAIQAFDKAIELDPDYARAWNSKGSALNAQGQHDEGIQAGGKANKATKPIF